MRSLASLVAATLLAAAPAAARADLGVGLRLGYSTPTGTAGSVGALGSLKQSDLYDHVIPIQLDLSTDFLEIFRIGVYGAYGKATAGAGLKSGVCNAASSCVDLVDSHLGVELQLVIVPVGPLRPWVGATAGWQRSAFLARDFAGGGSTPADLSVALSGWEGSLEAGLDFKLVPILAFGPYLQYAFGRYGSQKITWGAGDWSGAGLGSATHGAATLGLRAWLSL